MDAYGLHKVDMWAQNGTTDSDCENNYPGQLVRLSDFNYTNRRMSCYIHVQDLSRCLGSGLTLFFKLYSDVSKYLIVSAVSISLLVFIAMFDTN